MNRGCVWLEQLRLLFDEALAVGHGLLVIGVARDARQTPAQGVEVKDYLFALVDGLVAVLHVGVVGVEAIVAHIVFELAVGVYPRYALAVVLGAAILVALVILAVEAVGGQNVLRALDGLDRPAVSASLALYLELAHEGRAVFVGVLAGEHEAEGSLGHLDLVAYDALDGGGVVVDVLISVLVEPTVVEVCYEAVEVIHEGLGGGGVECTHKNVALYLCSRRLLKG